MSTNNEAAEISEKSNVKKKSSSKKADNKRERNFKNNYEYHLEKWLENTSKMNSDCNNFDGNYPFLNASNAAQQFASRKSSSNPQQYAFNDPVLLNQQLNSSLNGSPSVSTMFNFKHQYPQLFQQMELNMANDPMTSQTSQQDYPSLPTSLKFDKIPSTDQEKLNDVISQTRRFNDLVIDDAASNIMNGSSNSNRPNDSSLEDELEDHEDDCKNESKQNGANLSDKTLLVTLVKQINLLHETNSKIFRNLHETKIEMEALKFAPSWGLRNRRDSVSGLSVHSQPFGYGGMASPAPTYHSLNTVPGGLSNYPGVVTDLIREVRDAGRVRDESLMNRVRSLIDEKSWTANETNMRVLREIEEIKVHLHSLNLERQTTHDRLNKLEDEVRSIKVLLVANNNQFHHMPHFPTSSNLSTNDKIKKSSLNLNYGVMNSTGDGFVYDESSHSNVYLPRMQAHHEMVSGEANDDLFQGSHVMQLEKDTLKLRRDLQDAIASKKDAESRILALEHLVTSLKSSTQQTNTNTHFIVNANKNSLPSEFLQPQQHQLQIQINGADKNSTKRLSENVTATANNQTIGKLSPPKTAKASQVHLSSANGPVTDL